MKRYSVASVFLGMFAAWLAQPITGQEKESARRTWTDCAGKYTVEADFVEFKEGHVHLRKQNGEVVSVPLERLSLADQRYVKRMLASPEDVPDGARRTISCRLQYLTISPDGRTLASVGTSPDDHWKSELKLWSAATGRPLATLKDYFGSSSDWGQRYAAFTSDGKMFVGQARGPANPTGVLRHTVTPGFWDVRTGHMLQINTPRLLITNPPLRSETPFWHFDSETNQIRRPEMVSFGLDAEASLSTGFRMKDLGGGTALSPDGTAYAIVKGDGESIMLGDLDAKPRTTLQSAGSVGTLSFSPDGKLLVIACHEKAIEVWDFETGTQATHD